MSQAILCIALSLACLAGCERGTEESRALIAERRAAWAREISGIKAQHAALAVRAGSEGATVGRGPVQQRTRAVLDGTQQSIADVEIELGQCQGRMEKAVQRSGEAGRRAIDAETEKARGYLQSLVAQLGTAARQVDELTRDDDGDDKKQQATP